MSGVLLAGGGSICHVMLGFLVTGSTLGDVALGLVLGLFFMAVERLLR